jgi:hypothetical protein
MSYGKRNGIFEDFKEHGTRNASDMKIWFREDIARVLVGVNAASRATRPVCGNSDEYRDGFVAALVSVGLVVGISPEAFLPPDDVDSMRRRLKGPTS